MMKKKGKEGAINRDELSLLSNNSSSFFRAVLNRRPFPFFSLQLCAPRRAKIRHSPSRVCAGSPLTEPLGG